MAAVETGVGSAEGDGSRARVDQWAWQEGRGPGPSGALTGGTLGSVSLLSPRGSRASLLPFNLGQVLMGL